MTPSLGIEPGPHWWEASALTTTPSLFWYFHWLISGQDDETNSNGRFVIVVFNSNLLYNSKVPVANFVLISHMNVTLLFSIMPYALSNLPPFGFVIGISLYPDLQEL